MVVIVFTDSHLPFELFDLLEEVFFIILLINPLSTAITLIQKVFILTLKLNVLVQIAVFQRSWSANPF